MFGVDIFDYICKVSIVFKNREIYKLITYMFFEYNADKII